MNLKNILWVRNTGHIVPNAPLADNLFGMKLSGGVITTATGNPVSIVTNKAQNAISTLLSYSPKQSGSGDPSPTNIRPIEGWTEANLHVNEDTITANLGGTYYGFSVDLERGVLRVDTEYLTLDGTEDWASVSSGDSKYFRLNYAETGYMGNNGMCDQYKRISIVRDNTDVGFNLAFSSGYYQFRFRPENVSSVNTEGWKTMLANQPVHVVIYRSEPIEPPLTPQIVTLLKGNNTLWTDGDSLSVTYKAKK